MSETGKTHRDDMVASFAEGYNDRLRREEPRSENDRRSWDVIHTSSMPSYSAASSFNTSRISGNASVINAGHDVNIYNVDSSDEEKEIEKKKKDKEICHWLAAPDPTTNYHAAREIRHTQTGLWFIHDEKFARWKKISNRPLWLSGSPGCGKTIIRLVIIFNG
ncbi:hypothetical protein FIBSPDRAFT_368655 [Athelia psychrophila]|uniref:Nephrocystin 3-like N-terminal domain-containing protein n=1 Tax=Athelia psychrophila TaxID=1759441 RepID=A0A166P957_9AGAM|nr:hypothetical protein FIBSPDRAFT_368655 [Fibularhizoctonia sp. CBS 109695]